MTNDDPMYLRHLEKALEAAELEIKGLEGELREQDKILAEMQEQLAPTRMGEPMIRNCSLTDNIRDDDAARWRWITRDGRTRELRIPAEENKVSIDAAIDGKRLMLPNALAQGREHSERPAGATGYAAGGQSDEVRTLRNASNARGDHLQTMLADIWRRRMNDTDLLEAAAKVVGIPLKSDFKERFDYYMQDRLMWNPLRDDGDALRLAMALYSRGFMLEAGSGGVTVTVSHPVVMADEWCPSSGTFDPCAATRRAIVRAAAEIGKGVVTPND